MNDIPENMYYNPHTLLTHNAVLSMVLGGRGRGKTYAFKKYALTRNNPSMWLIRSDKELLATGRSFLEDMSGFQDDYYLSWIVEEEDVPRNKKKRISYPAIINSENEIKVYFSSLNVPNKGIPFPQVKNLIFDEFLIMEDRYKTYLPNEMTKFLDIFQTISRNKPDFRCIMMANEISIFNPYFAFYGIEEINKEKEFTWIRKPDRILQWVSHSPEWLEAYEKSAFRKAVEGTEYDAYMRGERALIDINVNVKPHPKFAKYLFNLIDGNNILGVWMFLGDYFVTDKSIDKTKGGYVSSINQTGVNRYYDAKLKRQLRDMIAVNKLFAETKSSRTKIMGWIK